MNKILATVIFFLAVSQSAQAAWRVTTSEDEMDNSFSVFATSPDAKPNKNMSWLYSSQKSWLGFGCNGAREWAYIGFSPNAPNMVADEVEDGYSIMDLRVKIDKKQSTTQRLTQDWGSKFVNFWDDAWAINIMTKGSAMKVEIPWYGEGDIIFSFDLSGSESGIKKARQKCLSAQ